ncbi:MAG: class I SAM-dependent methyltransferase [Acidobacteriota bacterium]|nr:class I SAM-dependent methyltransferase [Acidobacteriota bacterium]
MKRTVEECVVMAMDGTDTGLFPFLPYILQDLWEIGTSAEVVLELLLKHKTDRSNLKVLDLGCGKGAVSIKLAQELNCFCIGIDAIQEFVTEARIKARELNVEEFCSFECGDLRERVSDLRDCDIVVLAAVGPVLGDYYSTLTNVSKCLKGNGLIVIDDGYIDDKSEYSHPITEKRSVILKQISDAGMELIDEIITTSDEMKETDDYIYGHVKRRCRELIEKHPDKKDLFTDYVKKQEEENEALETKITCSTMLIGRNR